MASKQSPNAQSTNNEAANRFGPRSTSCRRGHKSTLGPYETHTAKAASLNHRGSPRILRLRSDGKLVPPGRPALSLGSVVQISAWELDDSQSRAMSRYRDPEPGRPGR
jgi:hypothetical protein